MSPLRILIVDDEEAVVKALAVICQGEGFDVVTSHDALDIERLLAHQRADILMCDNRMPGRTGVEVFAHCRRTHPSMMRILITSFIDRETALRAINEGHVDYLVEKPYRVAALRALLGEAAGVCRERARLAGTLPAPEPNVVAAAKSFRRTVTTER